MNTAFDMMSDRADQIQFLFPDEIREILRSCEDGTVIGIWDASAFPAVRQIYGYTVSRPDAGDSRYLTNHGKYLTRHGMKRSEEDLAMELYNFIEDGFIVTVNGTDILGGDD